MIKAKSEAEIGVDYYPKGGAECPFCHKKKIKIVTSRKWDGNFKIRYHRCNNPRCVLSQLGVSIKSIQSNE